MEFKFNHFNFNVKNLDESLKFYSEALGLTEVRRKASSDGDFILAFLSDGSGSFSLELSANFISPLKLRIWKPLSKSTVRWAASAMKTRTWGSIS